MKRTFTVNQTQIQTSLSDGEVLINDTTTARVSAKQPRRLTVQIKDSTKEVYILGRKGDAYIIGIDGKEVEVSVQDPFSDLRTKMGFHKVEESLDNDVRAPMPGKLLEILVSEGQEVAEGTPLFILEAMKMENIVKSPTSGVVSSLLSQAGETVQKNDVIIKF